MRPFVTGWWTANRPKAPQALNEELRRAFRIIREQPELGVPAKDVDLEGVRRVYLPRVRYHLYYRFDDSREFVELLALWHSSRAEGPSL